MKGLLNKLGMQLKLWDNLSEYIIWRYDYEKCFRNKYWWNKMR